MIILDAFSCIAGAFLLLMLPLDWLLSAFTAALAHEAGHILTVLLLGGRIRRIRVRISGCEIETAPMGEPGSVVCILAGPLASFLLLSVRNRFPLIAVFGLFQGMYNLLPVMPLDGGRVLRYLLCRFCPERAESVLRAVKGLVIAGIGLGALLVYLRC